jgi:hypothetical protein
MLASAQTAIVLLIVAFAALYVVRAVIPRKKQDGCAGCPANRDRRDDYA